RSKILQMPMEECAGKFSYPEAIKLEMFRLIYDALGAWRDRVFFYLCMEPAHLWPLLFGYDYASNEAFEQAMKESYLAKIDALRRTGSEG
ncbi:MAG: DNA photolyase, partial [Pseudomonadota bacterium]|nr:DNA photolyase [Pseudomonadota bacterium]